jgi:hypothetical protein
MFRERTKKEEKACNLVWMLYNDVYMKIQLTMSEITKMVRSYYALPDNITVEILEGKETVYNRLIDSFSSDGLLDTRNNIRIDKKIPAIKRLRELMTDDGKECGLANAKTAIEDWGSFSTYIHHWGMWPDMSPNAKNYSWT